MTLRRRHRLVLGSLLLFLLASAADAATYLTTLRTPFHACPSAKSAWRGVPSQRSRRGFVLFEDLVQRDVEW